MKKQTDKTASDAPEAPTYIKVGNKYVQRLYTPSQPRIFRTIRFRFNGRPRTLKNGLTETEAQAHCSRKDTRGNGWFDGYDYMKRLQTLKNQNNALMLKMDREREARRIKYDAMSNAQRATFTNSDR